MHRCLRLLAEMYKCTSFQKYFKGLSNGEIELEKCWSKQLQALQEMALQMCTCTNLQTISKCFCCRLQSCQQVQQDIDKKIKYALEETEAQQTAHTQLESDIAKLQKQLQKEV